MSRSVALKRRFEVHKTNWALCKISSWICDVIRCEFTSQQNHSFFTHGLSWTSSQNLFYRCTQETPCPRNDSGTSVSWPASAAISPNSNCRTLCTKSGQTSAALYFSLMGNLIQLHHYPDLHLRHYVCDCTSIWATALAFLCTLQYPLVPGLLIQRVACLFIALASDWDTILSMISPSPRTIRHLQESRMWDTNENNPSFSTRHCPKKTNMCVPTDCV